MAKWTAFPYDDTDYNVTAAALKKQWARLHVGDAEPLPKDAAVLAAWALFHAGEFQKAYDAGLKAASSGNSAGLTVANKAQSIYATYLEKLNSASGFSMKENHIKYQSIEVECKIDAGNILVDKQRYFHIIL